MGRILAIDYGTKRVGLAVTDPLQIIATPLTTVHPKELVEFLKEYHKQETIEKFVIGLPRDLQNQDTNATQVTENFIKHLKKVFPNQTVHTVDERFTSKIAFNAMLEGGMKKKDRRKKENIDKLSATVILQSFLESNQLL
ncbi:Holliday junction resolvase RuvX [Fulvivirgaceae bacterium BMA10]|uniref:Putative pre-16S rRNA nuclease n=1 Tax=Splendidivirga corallicola TaxID=3051826 RepID=A0ABT8KMB5_9BACT|nr:Holliday junction resolvase RuvX [Fulvivirgaceae bacterium BMA10]